MIVGGLADEIADEVADTWRAHVARLDHDIRGWGVVRESCEAAGREVCISGMRVRGVPVGVAGLARRGSGTRARAPLLHAISELFIVFPMTCDAWW